MSFKYLFVQEMNPISAPWVEAGSAARTAIAKVPLLEALQPQVQTAHKSILALRPQLEDPRLGELSDRESTIDGKHDDLVRGIYGALSGLALVSGASGELLRLRDMLLPEGLAHTQKSYRGEAGHAAMVTAQLDASLQTRLKAVQLHDKNLLDLVQAWLGFAKQLGDLEDERARLSEPVNSSSSDVTAARWGWVRVANAMVANAELAGIDADTDHLLFAALRAAERNSSSRGRGKPAPAPEPVPPAAKP